jgi:hypothetical protein
MWIDDEFLNDTWAIQRQGVRDYFGSRSLIRPFRLWSSSSAVFKALNVLGTSVDITTTSSGPCPDELLPAFPAHSGSWKRVYLTSITAHAETLMATTVLRLAPEP